MIKEGKEGGGEGGKGKREREKGEKGEKTGRWEGDEFVGSGFGFLDN